MGIFQSQKKYQTTHILLRVFGFLQWRRLGLKLPTIVYKMLQYLFLSEQGISNCFFYKELTLQPSINISIKLIYVDNQVEMRWSFKFYLKRERDREIKSQQSHKLVGSYHIIQWKF